MRCGDVMDQSLIMWGGGGKDMGRRREGGERERGKGESGFVVFIC